MFKLSVNLVVYNGEQYLPFLIDSLKRQTFKDWELVIFDNGSVDNTIAVAEKELVGSGINYRLIRHDKNIGFSSGHNLVFQQTQSTYVLLQNVDMYLMPDTFERMVNFLDAHPETAAVAPRLMRWDYAKSGEALRHGVEMDHSAKAGFTTQVDAIGIRLFRNRRAVEWLTREEWSVQSSNKFIQNLYSKNVCEVFGVSGALPMYRRNILEKVLLPVNNLFDPTYHSYKEDLDLAYRLRNAGYLSYVLLDTVAYHDRTGAGPREMGDVAALKNKKFQSYYVIFHSYKNHLRTLYKNEYAQNVWRDWPFIFWYEFKKFGFFLLTKPSVVINGWYEIVKHFAYLKSARKSVVASRRMHWAGIRRWFL